MPEDSKWPDGDAIKAARKAKNLTQKQLAKMVGYDVRTIQEAESGRERKILTFLNEIAQELGVPLESLIREEPEEVLESVSNEETGNIATLTATQKRKIEITTRDPDWNCDEESEFFLALKHLFRLRTLDEIKIIIARDRP